MPTLEAVYAHSRSRSPNRMASTDEQDIVDKSCRLISLEMRVMQQGQDIQGLRQEASELSDQLNDSRHELKGKNELISDLQANKHELVHEQDLFLRELRCGHHLVKLTESFAEMQNKLKRKLRALKADKKDSMLLLESLSQEKQELTDLLNQITMQKCILKIKVLRCKIFLGQISSDFGDLVELQKDIFTTTGMNQDSSDNFVTNTNNFVLLKKKADAIIRKVDEFEISENKELGVPSSDCAYNNLRRRAYSDTELSRYCSIYYRDMNRKDFPRMRKSVGS